MFLNPQSIVDQLGIIPGMQVADIGAGSGAYSMVLAKAVGDSGRVFAVDVQENLLTRLKSLAAEGHLNNLEIIWGDAEKIGGTKLKDDSLDAAVVSNVLFQAENKAGLVSEVKRILKKGGRAFVIDWSESFGNLGPTANMVVPPASAKEIFKKSGFEIVANFLAGAHHYGLTARKL